MLEKAKKDLGRTKAEAKESEQELQQEIIRSHSLETELLDKLDMLRKIREDQKKKEAEAQETVGELQEEITRRTIQFERLRSESESWKSDATIELERLRSESESWKSNAELWKLNEDAWRQNAELCRARADAWRQSAEQCSAQRMAEVAAARQLNDAVSTLDGTVSALRAQLACAGTERWQLQQEVRKLRAQLGKLREEKKGTVSADTEREQLREEVRKLREEDQSTPICMCKVCSCPDPEDGHWACKLCGKAKRDWNQLLAHYDNMHKSAERPIWKKQEQYLFDRVRKGLTTMSSGDSAMQTPQSAPSIATM